MGKLNAKLVATAPPKQKHYLINDGDGLNLLIKPNGLKYWHFRYRFDNKAKLISLGPYPEVSLQRAREIALQCRQDIINKTDPGAKRRTTLQEVAITSFHDVASSWYESKVKAGKAKSTLKSIRIYLKNDILPVLGQKDIASITKSDCAMIQEQIEKRGAFNTAEKVRGYLQEIFNYAEAKDLCDRNPATRLSYIAAPSPKTQHYPHLLESELPDFLKALAQTRSRLIALTASWMTIWTASRPGMVRFAKWDEFDFDNALWTVPAERMKTRRKHIVPLCSQLIILLKQLYQLTGRQTYLFPGSGSKNSTISENTINKVFHLIGYKRRMVGHGSRHTASTLLREHLWPKDIVEAQLAHKEMGVAGDYNHAAYVKYRGIMMQWYADYLDALKEGLTPELAAEFEKRRNTALYNLHQEPLVKHPLTKESLNRF